MGLELSALEKPACPYCGSNANERFGLNLEYDQCALIPTNAGSNKCIFLKTNSDSPYQIKRRGDGDNGFGCSVNTEKNKIRLAKRLIEIENRSPEMQIKAYEECGAVEYCPPGFAEGSTDSLFARHFMKMVPLGGKGEIKYYRPSSFSKFDR